MRKTLAHGALALLALAALPGAALAAENVLPGGAAPALEAYFPPEGPEPGYDASIPRPEAVLGHEIGSGIARHDLVVAWFEALAEASPRVTLLELGRTHEGRRQITALISSVRNIDDLREVQRAHLASEPGAPLVTWHGYGIHGDEASGVQAAMAVAWYLAASPDDTVREILRKTLIMIDPAQNPDGYGRFASWANQTRGRAVVADESHWARTPAWPGGQGNHYFFDLSKDWLLLQQPETRHRVRLLQDYRPHVMTDHHETGGENTFFLQPEEKGRRHALVPPANGDLTARFAQYHAEALDRAERLYARTGSGEDFHPGKGATWADLQGTVGLLFEQAGPDGLVLDRPQGALSLPVAIHNQVLATLSTLRASLALEAELRKYRVDFQERRHVPRDLPGAWVFDDGGDPGRAAAFVTLIKDQGLPVFGLTQSLTSGGREFLPGRAWVVPVLGAQAPLVQTLFANQQTFSDRSLDDVTAWSLPRSFGVSATALGRAPARLDTDSLVNRNYDISGRSQPVAWVLPWDDYYAPAALARLQAAGVRARVALEPFESTSASQPVRFRRGAVVIHESDVPDSDGGRRELLARVVAGQVPLVGLDSSVSVAGPDLGSPKVRPLEPARVAMLAGSGANALEVGSIWHALDARLGLPVTLVAPERLDDGTLERHTHLIVADGEYPRVPEAALAALGPWVERGGVLILTGRAVAWAQSLYWLPDPGPGHGPPRRYRYGDMSSRDREQHVGGAVVEVDLDATHPLAFGIAEPAIGLMRRSRVLLKAPWSNPFTVVAAYTDDPLVDGALPDGLADDLAGSPALLAVPRGDGVIVAFADSPAFRGVWWVGERLLANAISFGSVIRAPSGDYGPDPEEPDAVDPDD